MILHRLRGFRRDQGGQIAFVTLFGAVALAGLLGLVMTTGDQASLKVETQNAADAAALSGGAWIARGLNLTSAINVIQTQLVGAAIVLQALRRILEIDHEILFTEEGIYSACLPFCAIPWGIVTGEISLLPGVIASVMPVINFLSSCQDGFFWFTSRILQGLNTAIHVTFFAIAFAEALSVAETDGAEFSVFLPGPLFHGSLTGLLTLPTEEAEFSALCDPMEHGSPTPDERGYTKLLHYPAGQGPLALGKCRLSIASAAITGVPPFGPVLLPVFANHLRDQLCGKTTQESVTAEIEQPAKDLAECKRLKGTAHWNVTRVETDEPVLEERGCAWFASQRGSTPPPYQGLPNLHAMPGSSVDQPCTEQPSGERIDDHTYCSVNMRRQETGSSPARYFHSLTIWTLESTSVRKKVEVKDPPGQTGGCGELPRPYLLQTENDALKFLAVVRRSNRRIFFSDKFLEDSPSLYTYAQVEVYSGISSDTFNQDWRVRLDRAELLEKPFGQLGDQVSGFLADLNRFASLLPIALPQDGLSSLAQGVFGELFNRQRQGDSSTDDGVLNH